MYKNKKLTIITTILSFLLFGVMIAENNYEFKTLMELQFDKEIEDVAFDSYEENGQIKFYPKIVVLREVDPDASSGSVVNYALEVRILDRKGKTIWQLPNLKYFSKVYFSNNGNYFGIYREFHSKDKDLFVSNKRALFTLYDDNGKICWQRKDDIYGLSFGNIVISPQNGSVFALFTSDDVPENWKSYFYYFDSIGNQYSLISDRTTNGGIVLSDNGEYLGLDWTFRRFGFLNSSGKLLWEKTLREPINTIAISKNGDYVFIGGTFLSGVISSNGYIYNNKGELVTKVSLPYIITNYSDFSENGQYLLFSYRDYKEYKEPAQDWFIAVNIQQKKELYRVSLPQNIHCEVKEPFIISDAGDVAVISEKNLILLNNNGKHISKCDITGLEKSIITQGIYQKIGTLKLLGWRDAFPVLGWIGHKDKKIKIITLERR